MNPNRQVFEYRGARTAECYNQFFNPNICHVCKAVDKGNLILCDECCLISYCNNEHKILHYEEHAHICKIIAQILKVKPQSDTRRFDTWQQWIESRKYIVESIEQSFCSLVETYVKQMIMWSKTCVICHQQAELRACQKCFSVNFCNEHAETFRKKHDEATCELLTRLLNINIETISGTMTVMSYKFFQFIQKNIHVHEMLEFYIEYVLTSRNDIDWLVKDYVLSDYLSDPMTVFYGLHNIYRNKIFNVLYKKFVIIHIIAANSVERHSVSAWEILLHLIPEIHNLVIFIIGPELQTEKYEHNICDICRKKGKVIFSFFICILYHHYIRFCKTYQKPDLIVRFAAELDKQETWSESIKVIQNYNCPLLLGATCKEKARNDITAIQKALNMNIEPVLNSKNYYAGLAPHKDLMSGIIYFRNEYVIIYTDLSNYE